ncbi:MAG: glycosyltransferase family 2 protein [Kiritimatiellae bacterium]|nr:glycosyltransferase family 2 protein [Kiritimatiellia bacterium]
MNRNPSKPASSERPVVSVVIPVYNEAEALPGVLDALRRAMPPDWEAVLVDDGSTDATPSLLRAAAAADSRLRPLRFPRNLGQSAAFFAGFRAARAPIIATMDADGQNDPEDLPRIVAALDGTPFFGAADVICGWRATRRDSFSRRVASRLAGAIRRALLRDGVRDTGCSLKAFRREYLDGLAYWDGMHRFLPALCAAAGARIAQLPVRHHPRAAGRSKYSNFGRLLRTFPDLLGVRWYLSRAKSLPQAFPL